jgi:predicted nucleotidyltransferase
MTFEQNTFATTNRPSPEQAAGDIYRERYPEAEVLLLAGSVVSGEATSFSDLDIVVVFKNLPQARRESFFYKGWPVEAFVHDIGTLRYFFYEMDAKSGIPSLPQMVAEGLVIRDVPPFSSELKRMAGQVISAGPPIWDEEQLKRKRYQITDILDDMREPRSAAELTASAVVLYETLGDFFLRANGLWSASGKRLPRRIRTVNPALADRFEAAFDEVFRGVSKTLLFDLAEEVLSPYGGPLFDGYSLHAPNLYRMDAGDTD